MGALKEMTREEAAGGEKAQLFALVEIIEQLSAARTAEDVGAVVTSFARRTLGADGVTLVLRDGEQCWYVGEDALGPLGKGGRVPMQGCISGWAMLHGRTAVVPDIYADDRVPHEVYRPTFVRSLVMTPVRPEAPIGAIGAYWARVRDFPAEAIATLEVLARATATALENVRLIVSLQETLAQRDGLIRDLDHRVKNNLAAVRAIAQQTLRSAVSPDAFAEGFNGRLMALGSAHELIAGMAEAGVPLKLALQQGLGEAARARVRLAGPEVRLAPETAVNILMAAHELATNARRHGALSAEAGDVELVWSVAGGRLELDWRERGGPGAQPPKRPGFGLRMLSSGLPRSLGGEARLQFGDEGLRYSLSVPLSTAVRAPPPTH